MFYGNIVYIDDIQSFRIINKRGKGVITEYLAVSGFTEL
jgi:hypothetical protein